MKFVSILAGTCGAVIPGYGAAIPSVGVAIPIHGAALTTGRTSGGLSSLGPQTPVVVRPVGRGVLAAGNVLGLEFHTKSFNYNNLTDRAG